MKENQNSYTHYNYMTTSPNIICVIQEENNKKKVTAITTKTHYPNIVYTM